MDDLSAGRSRHSIVLSAVLRALRPLVRLLLKHGVTYPELAQALKPVFVQAAREELAQRGMGSTDSAITLLCGVHRKDVRELTRGAAAEAAARARAQRPPPAEGTDSTQVIDGSDGSDGADALEGAPGEALPLSLSGELVGAWLALPRADAQAPPPLDRAAFDALASRLSQDIRPRAWLDELQRLGVVQAQDDGTLLLRKQGFAPREGLAEMAQLMADNLGDHAAATAANLQGEENFLEQAMYVDRLRPESVARVRQAARQAWQRTLRQVLQEAQARYDEDEALPPAEQASRKHRARFGVYFFSQEDSSS
ncbi:MAG: hypothetical protein JNJ71_19650 [Rubrivivax sp.]|nr:hypothetical protein [Rubrivivax sp.]